MCTTAVILFFITSTFLIHLFIITSPFLGIHLCFTPSTILIHLCIICFMFLVPALGILLIPILNFHFRLRCFYLCKRGKQVKFPILDGPQHCQGILYPSGNSCLPI